MDVKVTLEPETEPAEIEASAQAAGFDDPIGAPSEERDSPTAVATEVPADIVEPRISAIIVAYNHERYIRQALDSVLSQKTDFPFEVIVSEDRSTDGTADVINSYIERYPDRIRLIRSEVNLRSLEVVLRAMRQARGRYITLLDGDDYWVSPDKLQAQFDFMEAHSDSALTYHDVERVTDDGDIVRVVQGLGRRGTIEDLIKGNFIATCSVMLRRAALPDLPDWISEMPAGDWPLYLLAARSGFIDHIEGVISRYRIHGNSFWASRPLAEQQLMGLCMQIELEAHLGPDFAPLFEKSRRDTARHVLATVLKDTHAERATASEDAPRSEQAEASARTHRIYIAEMQTRINEVEAKRAEAQWRADSMAGNLLAAEAGRDEAWRHAGNLAAQMANSQATIADIMARHWNAVEEFRRLEAQVHAAEAHGRQLQDALETAQLEEAVARRATEIAEAHERQVQEALDASRRQMELAETRQQEVQDALDAARRQAELAETRQKEVQDVLDSAHQQLEVSGIHGQDLQSAVHASIARVRRIRRREKRIGIGLGLVIAALVAVIVHIQWF